MTLSACADSIMNLFLLISSTWCLGFYRLKVSESWNCQHLLLVDDDVVQDANEETPDRESEEQDLK